MALINDRYELIRIIGKGGFGTTWYARDTKLDMPVAVKELSDTDPSRKKKFLREARTLARFAREPGIVNVRDYLEYNGKAYMVMEYLDGSDLNTKIAEGGPISFDAAYHLLRPVILVLGKLHAEGVIHRDVSPDNIRMQSDGTIKLLDFGAAWNTTSTENATTTITVKPGYAPYEQYAGKERQGPFTDVYAVCATLYKCITGVTPPDALKRAFYDEIKAPSLLGARITPAEEAILMKGLAVNSSDRIQSMEELARLLDKAVGESSPEISGAFKSSMGSAGAAGRANGGRAFKSSVGKRSSEADSAHKDSPEKKNAKDNGKLQEQSTQGYAPHNYAVQDQTAHGYTAQSYAAQNYNAQGQPAQDYAAQNFNAQGQPAQGYAAQNYSEQGQPAQSSSFVNSKQPGRDSAPDNIEKSDRKRRSESAYSGKPRRGIPKKPLIGLIMLVAAAIGIVFFIFSRGENNDSYRKTGSGEAVVLEKTPVTSERLQAIEKDANIKSLTLIRCELSDSMVEEISRITHLEKLRIDGCTGFTTLDPLADAPALNHLSITGQISNEYIEGSVNLDGSKLFTRDLPNVLTLSVTGSRIDGGTDCLGHFPNLETISLSLLEPYSIACIDKMPKLKEIELYDFDPSENDYLNLSGEEAKHLYGHPQLEILIAEDSNLSDLGWAAECTKLRDLFLSNCLISDLSPLADLTDLKWLHLSNNKVESVLPLSGCEKLEEIRLSGNPLTSLSGLEGLKNLE
ncbi:MAG: protein kinase, partial [Eubacteriales bacterium]